MKYQTSRLLNEEFACVSGMAFLKMWDLGS